MIRSFALAGLVLMTSAAMTPAGKFNKVLSVGDAAPAWKDLEATDGKKYAIEDFKNREFLVVLFTCNSCPVAVGYEDRILAFAKKHAGPQSKVGLVAINVNTVKDDQLPEMKKRAEKKQFSFPYLYDPSQEIARKFGATITPEFFLLDKNRKVIYMGALDDRSPPGESTLAHLDEALTAALAGKPVATPETNARGCKIRFNAKP